MLDIIIVVVHILISFVFFTYISYRRANSMSALLETTFCDEPDYDFETYFSIIFWPVIPIVLCARFIYNFSLYEKFLKLLKKKEKPAPEIDEAKSNYKKTIYK